MIDCSIVRAQAALDDPYARDAEHEFWKASRGISQRQAEERRLLKRQRALDALVSAANGGKEFGTTTDYLRVIPHDPCAYCGCPAPVGRSGGHTIDHIVPRCDGGPDHWSNLTAACWSCNGPHGKWTVRAWLWLAVLAERRDLMAEARNGR